MRVFDLDGDIIDSLCARMESNGVVLLAGAGVSAAHPSCIPLFRPLRDELLRCLSESLDGILPDGLRNQCSHLFAGRTPDPVPEALFEALYTPLGDHLFSLLRIFLTGGAPNSQHEMLASLLGREIVLLATTNFDVKFEEALDRLGCERRVCADDQSISASAEEFIRGGPHKAHPAIWKLHGTIAPNQESTIRITLGQIARARREVGKTTALVRVAEHWPLLVIGYSGYDPDISEALKAAGRSGRGLFWLSRRRPEATSPARVIVGSWGEKGLLLTGDIADLLTRITARLGKPQEWTPPTGDCGAEALARAAEARMAAAGLDVGLRLVALSVAATYFADFSLARSLLAKLGRHSDDAEAAAHALFSLFEIAKGKEDVAELEAIARHLDLPSFRAARVSSFREQVLGEVALVRGDVQAAERHYRQALTVGRQQGHDPGALSQSLGVALVRQGRLDEAEPYFVQAVEIAEQVGDVKAVLKGRHELGIIRYERGQVEQASRLFTLNLQVAEEIGDLVIQGASLFELGLIALRYQKDLEKAATSFRESYRLAKLAGRMPQAIDALICLSEVLEERGDLSGAEFGFTGCLANAIRIGARAQLVTALARRARVRMLMGDYVRARMDLSEARGSGSAAGFPAIEAEIDGLFRACDVLESQERTQGKGGLRGWLWRLLSRRHQHRGN